jgi:hypothetical protein
MTQGELVGLIAAAAGLILSLAVTYYKPLSAWFYGIPENFRGLANIGLNVVAALAIFGISCSQLFGLIPCTQQSAVDLFRAILYMIGTNQIVYLSTPTSPTKLAIEQSKLASYTAELQSNNEFLATAEILKAEKDLEIK